jgi:sugar phosphate isomerase/epimerase
MSFTLALCNEVLRDWSFAEQCRYAAALGYQGLEVAPFTLEEHPHLLPPTRRVELKQIAEDCGISIVGLHWLLVTPPGLSISSPEPEVRQRTTDVIRRLIELCSQLGGTTLVHGSPQQRAVGEGESFEDAWNRATDVFASIAPEAEAAGVRYCIEPLGRNETNFINTIEEAAGMAGAAESHAVCTMLDARSARSNEEESIPQLIDKWLPTGMIGHVHLNDLNRRGPGQGDDRFKALLQALARNNYSDTVSVEPFDYHPDGPGSAAFCAGYIRGLIEDLLIC